MKKLSLILFVLMFLSILGCSKDNDKENTSNGNPTEYDNGQMKLPPGFIFETYAKDVDGARSMCLGDNGTLFVGTRGEGVVYAIVDTNKDFKADRKIEIATGLNSPNGVAFQNGSLYVAEISRIIRFDNIENQLDNPPAYVIVNDQFPSDASHGWKFIRIGPDNKLYVPVGAPCNVCESADEKYASIMRMNLDGSGLEVYAKGIRNTVGFDWQPSTGHLWFTDNGRDMLGDDVPPDELNRAPQQNMHFGFPYVHGNSIVDPEFGAGKDISIYTKPMKELGPHVAALGMRFYKGNMFPASYKNQIFIAEHGSWNRTNRIGYRVMSVTLDNENNVVSYEPFVTGWLIDNGNVSGRPVDVQELPDGSLLVSDDRGNAIYRITYK